MNPRTTAVLLLVALGLGAFVYFYELKGEGARLDAEERGKRVFAGLEPDQIDWITLRTTDGVDARFERHDGAWQLTSPIVFPADPAVDRMADTLATATHEAVFENPQPDAEYGLDDASARIVHFGAGDAEHELRLGKPTPVGSNVYVRTGESPAVQTIADYRAKAFERSLTDLRRKQILDFDPSTVRELEVSWPGGRVVLEREEKAPPAAPEGEAAAGPEAPAAWRMTAPVEAPGDADAVDDLLSALSYLRADGFADEPTEAQRRLLDPPDFAVVLRTGEARDPIPFAVGRPDADEHRWVRVGGSPVLFQIAADRIDDFERKTVAYRNRTLARFALGDAQQIDFFFQAKGDPLALHARRGPDGWTSSPEQFGPGVLTRVASELSRLEATDVMAESMGEKELEALGLSPPATTITVLGAEPESAPEGDELPPPAPRLAEVYFGHPTPDGVPARALGDPAVYRLALDAAEHVPVSLDAFRTRFRAQPEAKPGAPAAGAAPAEELVDPAEESP